MKGLRLVRVVLTLVLGLSAVACSAPAPASPGGGASSAAQSGASGSAQQGVDNKVISIGMASILSGPSASASAISEAAKVYLDMVNRKGGVNGYTFKYVQRDTANQPAQAVAVAQQLLNEDKVFATIIEGTPGMQALVPIAPSLREPILAASLWRV